MHSIIIRHMRSSCVYKYTVNSKSQNNSQTHALLVYTNTQLPGVTVRLVALLAVAEVTPLLAVHR